FKTFSSEHAVHQCLVVAAVLNGIDDVCLSLIDLGQLRLRCGASATAKLVESSSAAISDRRKKPFVPGGAGQGLESTQSSRFHEAVGSR
ncbi:hypothetical protein, partial [Sphingomonas sp. PP-F2F-G114-C0414]|uniref:hypothetical protein n=1 Tax=Sphingomonas sp. PP-F2F-G114-C0414 TaxID=2135662 RepID=UPI001C7CC5C5